MVQKPFRSEIVPFTMTPVWVLDKCGPDSRAVHLYALLMKHANVEGRAWPGNERLTAAMDVSLSTLERAIATLRSIGALKTERRRRADGSVAGRSYLLVQTDPASATPDEAERSSQNVTSDSLQLQPVTGDGTILSLVTGTYKDELDQLNQIKEQREGAPSVLALLPSDLEAFRLAWNAEVVDPIKPCALLTRKRRQWVRAALAERPLAAWVDIFARVNASTFCRGEKGWRASLDWLIKSPEPAIKVLEGQYDDHLTEAELRAAQDVQFRTGGGCRHDPRCSDWRECVRELALSLRQRRAS